VRKSKLGGTFEATDVVTADNDLLIAVSLYRQKPNTNSVGGSVRSFPVKAGSNGHHVHDLSLGTDQDYDESDSTDVRNGKDMCAATCAENEYVHDHVCYPCLRGTFRGLTDRIAGPNTVCAAAYCPEGTYAIGARCVKCPLGTTYTSTEKQDAVGGEHTRCTPTLCKQGYKVVGHECKQCDAGKWIVYGGDRGDGEAGKSGDASGKDTACEDRVCSEGFHVQNKRCVRCEPWQSRPAGDVVSGPDTTCVDLECGEGQGVDAQHQCVDCVYTNSVSKVIHSRAEEQECLAREPCKTDHAVTVTGECKRGAFVEKSASDKKACERLNDHNKDMGANVVWVVTKVECVKCDPEWTNTNLETITGESHECTCTTDPVTQVV